MNDSQYNNRDNTVETHAMVLLVDDQALVGESLRRLLAHERDINFHFCSDGGVAVEQARKIQPTVILQDLVMPGVNGLDLVKQYRSDPVLKDIPVLVLSVREEPEMKRDAFAAGADDYLVKLPDRLEMLARIRYHSTAYLARRDRDDAMRALRESQRELLDSNTALISLNQRLDIATKAKSEFLAMMSHEIRTPLNGVLGFSDLLSETKLDGDQHSFVETIRSSGRALLTVINDILDFSKIEAGKLTIENETFNISQCLREACELFLPKTSDNHTELAWEVAPELAAFAVGDPMRLRQIVSNLVSNAVKFTKDGHIRVRASKGTQQELDVATGKYFPPEDPKSFYLRVSVVDDGIGVPPDKRAQLFKTFDQLDPSTARKFGGSGLGLTICRRLCQLMGGEIWYLPGKETGSQFVFMVRLSEAADIGSVTPGSPLHRDGKIFECLERSKVLVAEDNRVNAALINVTLKKFGISAETVSNGALALEAVKTNSIDLIFMDIQMPEMDGLEATRHIRAYEREQGLSPCYIVALTAEAMQGDADRCIAAGMNDYLSKPFRPADLDRTLAKYCLVRTGTIST